MPSTYTLIKGETIGSSAASYTFTAIPSTFTDLVVRISARSSRSSESDPIIAKFNSTTSGYSRTVLLGDGSGVASSRTTSASSITIGAVVGNTATANTFNNLEMLVPSYTVSQNKPMGVFGVNEDNNVIANMNAIAVLWSNTAAITSIQFTLLVGPNFLAGSSFYLYGIKSS